MAFLALQSSAACGRRCRQRDGRHDAVAVGGGADEAEVDLAITNVVRSFLIICSIG